MQLNVKVELGTIDQKAKMVDALYRVNMAPIDSTLCKLSVAKVTADRKERPGDMFHERRDQFSHFHFEKIVFLFPSSTLATCSVRATAVMTCCSDSFRLHGYSEKKEHGLPIAHSIACP
jgi:hypothetical protein